MVGGKVFRVIDSRSWDAGRRIDDMSADDVDVQVVSPMPELLSHWFPAADADALCRYINEGIAELCNANPGNSSASAWLRCRMRLSPSSGSDEIKSLGLRGIEIGSHINGIPLGDIRLHDIYAAAEQAGLMVMVHPLHPLGLDRMGGRPGTGGGGGISARNRVCCGVADDQRRDRAFPKSADTAEPRRRRAALDPAAAAARQRPSGPPLDSLFPRDPGEMVKSFYYDTILYDDVALNYLVTKVGKDRLVAGSDYPFTIKQDRPAEFAEQVLGRRA